MKKLMTLSFIVVAVLAACTKKAAPGATPGSNGSSSSNETTISPAEAQKNAATEKAAVEAMRDAEKKADNPSTSPSTNPSTSPAAPNKPSEEDAGQLVYKTKCTKCHAAKTVSAYTFTQWEGILKSMVPKANLSADEENQVVAYIRMHAK